MKTKSFLAIALIFSSLLVFTGCRKGEDDPFLSFRSRTARLTGEWKLKSGEIVYTGTDSFSSPDTGNDTTVIITTQFIFTESSLTYSSSSGSSNTSDYTSNDY